MDGIASLTRLEHLELYDNQIRHMSSLDALVNLRVLDLSFNAIRTIPDLRHLVHLEELYVANNKLTRITGVAQLHALKKLDLGANRIRVIEGLDGLAHLEQLWLGKNKIEKMEGLETLTALRIISVQVRMSWFVGLLVSYRIRTLASADSANLNVRSTEQPAREDRRIGGEHCA